jgi:hypothetical protein
MLRPLVLPQISGAIFADFLLFSESM